MNLRAPQGAANLTEGVLQADRYEEFDHRFFEVSIWLAAAASLRASSSSKVARSGQEKTASDTSRYFVISYVASSPSKDNSTSRATVPAPVGVCSRITQRILALTAAI